jgi:hypothetical protein
MRRARRRRPRKLRRVIPTALKIDLRPFARGD